MIRSFANAETEDIYNGRNSRAARQTLPSALWAVAFRKLDQLEAAAELNDLRVPPGNRLEKLSGSRADQHSIRINDQYRICFVWTASGPDQVEILDYH
ncbi:MAG: type II toxin-antitoxin system RelE/ParE family toxin [Chloroflexi bacterium]|nr:type II toxin-antitoxin system RelE/ParE family toxin [Chloroflexota bacterium]